jgi:hypothetical protein
MSKAAKRSRSARTGHFVTPGYAAAHPDTTVTERARPAPIEAGEVTFKRGDRIEHPAVGKATVTSGRLGPHGELKVRPDEPHHSGKKIVEVMARRCIKLNEEI